MRFHYISLWSLQSDENEMPDENEIAIIQSIVSIRNVYLFALDFCSHLSGMNS